MPVAGSSSPNDKNILEILGIAAWQNRISNVYLYSDAQIGVEAFDIGFDGRIYNLSESIEDEELDISWKNELGTVYRVTGDVNGEELLLGKVSVEEEELTIKQLKMLL